jgi:hypothetical protein
MEVSEEVKADEEEEENEEEEEEEEEEEKKEVKTVASALSMKGYTGKAKAKGKGKTPTAAASTKEVIAKIRGLPDTYKSLPYKVSWAECNRDRGGEGGEACRSLWVGSGLGVSW